MTQLSRKLESKWIKILGLVVGFFFLITLFEGIGLGLFNFFFGNSIPVIVLSYNIRPISDPARNIQFEYSLYLTTLRVPVETQSLGKEIKVLDNFTIQNRKLTITLPIQITTENTQLYSETLTFYDANSRIVYFYLKTNDKTINFICNGRYSLEAINPIDIESFSQDLDLSKVFET